MIHSWHNCKIGGCDECCSNPDCEGECEECCTYSKYVTGLDLGDLYSSMSSTHTQVQMSHLQGDSIYSHGNSYINSQYDVYFKRLSEELQKQMIDMQNNYYSPIWSIYRPVIKDI